MPPNTCDSPEKERTNITGDRRREGIKGLGGVTNDGNGAVGGKWKETEGVDYLSFLSLDKVVL